MANTEEYQFVPLKDDNLHLLIDLYQKVFKINYSLEEIKAKYQPLYTGLKAQGHFAFKNGAAVAFHGAIPFLMRYKGKVELAAQYGDAMTLKSHTGKGLFTKLGQLTDQLLQKNEVRFVWGFPNQNSEFGYVNKLAWQGKLRMQCYIFQLSKVSSEVLFRKTKLLEQKKQEKIYRTLQPLLTPRENLHSINTSEAGGVDRSKELYAYKSFSKNYFIQIASTKVWIKTTGGLLVGDLEVRNENQVLNALEELKQLAKQLGLNKLVIQLSPGTQLNQILSKHFKAIDSWLIGYKNFNSEFPLEKLQFTYGDLDTF